MDRIEPFDEWEEFILFASHYSLVQATHIVGEPMSIYTEQLKRTEIHASSSEVLPETKQDRLSCQKLQFDPGHMLRPRRFGALFGSHRYVAYYGGIDESSRTNKTELYNLQSPTAAHADPPPKTLELISQLSDISSARVCHAVATANDGRVFIAGGRASPGNPLADCMYFCERWKRVQDLPIPLFRHCMTWVNTLHDFESEPGILLYGGKTSDNIISAQWLFWQETLGWRDVLVRGSSPQPTFGAAISCVGDSSGVLIGGMTNAGILQPDLWEWRLCMEGENLYVDIDRGIIKDTGVTHGLARMGAQLISSKTGLLLVGGTGNITHSEKFDIVKLVPPQNLEDSWSSFAVETQMERGGETGRSLLVGHATLQVAGSVLVVGGGAVCFSFGTFWNQAALLLTADSPQSPPVLRLLTLSRTDLLHEGGTTRISSLVEDEIPPSPSNKVSVTSITLGSSSSFPEVIGQRKPAILRDLDIGPCRNNWTLDGLKSRIGEARQIVVHQAMERSMNFLKKNFVYRKKSMANFIDDITQGSPQYVRSLAAQDPSNKPANLADDFPELKGDFFLPHQLGLVSQNMHSSVLRISGPVDIWLHYDVMANVLCNIIGTKRLLLYPPSDVACFAIPPGASSSPIPVFSPEAIEHHPSLALAHPHEILLREGEILFIPPLWLHAASPEDNVSVSVNVFFRDLESGYAPGKDTYGNRDIQAYEKGRKDVEKIVKTFEKEKLPADMVGFYLERLAEELKQSAKDHFRHKAGSKPSAGLEQNPQICLEARHGEQRQCS